MDSYNERGAFPTSIETRALGGNDNENPVRCHYRPRSFMPVVLYLIWAYLTLPLLFSTVQTVFGTGLMSLVGIVAVIALSMFFF